LNEFQKTIDKNLAWIIRVLSLPQKIKADEFEKFFTRSEDDPIAKTMTGIQHLYTYSEYNYCFFPFVPNMQYPPIVKPFIITSEDISSQSAPSDLGFTWFTGDDGTYCTVSYCEKFHGSIRVIFIPDMRDILTIVGVENRNFSDLTGFPLSDQLEQELNEAKICMDHKLPIAVIATLSIAIETACKIVLETNNIPYSRNKDGLNDLMNSLVRNDLMSEKDRQACLALKGLRNAVDHAHSGTVSLHHAEMFYKTGVSLIQTILQSAVHNGSTQN